MLLKDITIFDNELCPRHHFYSQLVSLFDLTAFMNENLSPFDQNSLDCSDCVEILTGV